MNQEPATSARPLQRLGTALSETNRAALAGTKRTHTDFERKARTAMDARIWAIFGSTAGHSVSFYWVTEWVSRHMVATCQ